MIVDHLKENKKCTPAEIQSRNNKQGITANAVMAHEDCKRHEQWLQWERKETNRVGIKWWECKSMDT